MMGKIASRFWERHIHNLISEHDQTWKGGSRIDLWNTDAIGGNKVQIWKTLHFDPAPTQGHVISVNNEQPFDELTSKFGYFMTLTLNTCEWDGITDRQIDKRTDDPTNRSSRYTFQAWGIKRHLSLVWTFAICYFYLIKCKYRLAISSWLLLWPHISGISEECFE